MSETVKRAISGAVYIIILLFSVSFSEQTFFLLFGIFLCLTVFEFCNLIKLNYYIPIAIALSIYSYSYTIRSTDLYTKEILALTIATSIYTLYFLFKEKYSPSSIVAKTIFLLGYIIFSFLFITKIPFGEKGYNPKIIISIFVLIWTNDTFAYLVGKSVGKHKLFERISPKKTIEGFLGGLVFAVFAGYLLSKLYFNPSPQHSEKSIIIWTATALIVSVFGTLGDLIESKFKRVANVKDSGKIMPGHGGILDRLDSVIFVAPFIYLFYQILNYVS
jgi:phosphatidate cytidylyltransferase